MATTTRRITPPKSFETTAWKWMRYSGILLIPLVWIHVLIQDVVVGVHAIDTAYVIQRWSSIGWQVYDILLLGFAFAHGVNGLRQVVNDFLQSDRAKKIAAWLLFIGWLIITTLGGFAIIAAAQNRLAEL